MLCSARKKSRETGIQEIKHQQAKKNGLNVTLIRNEGNGGLEEKAKERELFSLKKKNWEICEKQLYISNYKARRANGSLHLL